MSEKKSAWRSPWVIAWVGLVAGVLAVNLLMVYFAIDSSPGLVVEDYYQRGQDYEENLFKKRKDYPGWQMQIDTSHQPVMGSPTIIRFSINDKQGQAVAPDAVALYAYRPSDARMDISVTMVEQSIGRYQAEITFPLKGAWDILVSVKLSDQEYHSPKRIDVLVAE